MQTEQNDGAALADGLEVVHFASAAGRDQNVTACGVDFVYPLRGNGWRASEVTCPACSKAMVDATHAALRAQPNEPSEAMVEDALISALCDAADFVDAAVGEGVEVSGLDPLGIYEDITGSWEDSDLIDWSRPGELRQHITAALSAASRNDEAVEFAKEIRDFTQKYGASRDYASAMLDRLNAYLASQGES
ncbi:hypothetical protein [Novosphingopyxis sp. YJ-S2-01]|uniref:hypothetical protein n=1 Tax=Novosphingopyxis sp. YJ-S2-01 TaxID=2794021 RepID=UPI0018DCAD66|nr:hypothetical protein [Novosphingopyxis sp. YJ-S2-01]MBH9537545.1 hypothetical protein [Novosphingopyxis sp. YJ-S2-01]